MNIILEELSGVKKQYIRLIDNLGSISNLVGKLNCLIETSNTNCHVETPTLRLGFWVL